MKKAKSFEDRRLDNWSRMNREVHVRFREGVGVKFPCATRLRNPLFQRLLPVINL
ncbi:MAG: hypothetical protein ABSG71_21480 [Thermodesulfobacteriota bacterium]